MNKKRKWLTTALLALLTLGITSGFVLARSNTETKLATAVENGTLTQEQADAKLQAIADGKTRMKKGNHWHKKGFGNFKGKLGKGSRT